jgi:hypothetical protein
MDDQQHMLTADKGRTRTPSHAADCNKATTYLQTWPLLLEQAFLQVIGFVAHRVIFQHGIHLVA